MTTPNARIRRPPTVGEIEEARALDELMCVGPEVRLDTEREWHEWRVEVICAALAQARAEERERLAIRANARCCDFHEKSYPSNPDAAYEAHDSCPLERCNVAAAIRSL